jgi:flavin-binding protein dodecin
MAYSVVFTLPSVIRQLLQDSSDLAGVEILTGPRQITGGKPSLAAQNFRATASRPITGGYRREAGTFMVYAHVEVSGAGEDAIDAARASVDGLLDAVSDVLDADYTIDGNVLHCDVTEVAEDDQGVTDAPAGHTFTAHVTVSFTADVRPGA